MRHVSELLVIGGLSAALALAGCDDDEAKEAEDTTPVVGVMELPISHRTGDPEPSGACSIEISPSELHVGGEQVAALQGGRIGDGDASKVKSSLQGCSSSAALQVHAQTPYATLSQVMGGLHDGNVRTVAFKGRDPENPADAGWLSLGGFKVVDSLPEDETVALPGVTKRSWDDFAPVWESVQQACRGARSGSCAYKPENIAEGGDLRIQLEAHGDGMNLVFQRVGGEPVEEQAKEDEGGGVAMLEGVRRVDPVEEVEDAPPATIAQFQFRSKEASAASSAISETIAPLCGKTACGVVLEADSTTMAARVISLLGAAFPDGAPKPSVGFVRP